MVSTAENLGISYADYLALEAATGLRHQFIDGVAWAMAGGEPEHARIAVRVIVALDHLVRGGRCHVYSSDLKVRIPATGNAYYPDAAVCGAIERHPGDRLAVTNPVLLVEVLSPTTAGFDRGEKFEDYQRLSSLRHYLLVSVASKRVEHYRRNDNGTWTYAPMVSGESLPLSDLGGAIAIDDMYPADTTA